MTIIYESTVAGVLRSLSELEKASGLDLTKFYCGYSIQEIKIGQYKNSKITSVQIKTVQIVDEYIIVSSRQVI